MSIGRAVTNYIGNALATVAISRYEGKLSEETLKGETAGKRGIDV